MTQQEALISYTLYLADSSLVMGHRLSEWAAHGPTLEQDIAISNIALDLIGQSRNFYQYAALLTGNGATEDTLAYFRDDKDFKNSVLVELPNSDWAHTVLKVFIFSTYQYYLYLQLVTSKDSQLAAIAEKSLKEITYHKRWSSEWILRLGDGTEDSHLKMQQAITQILPFQYELFLSTDYEMQLENEDIAIRSESFKSVYDSTIAEIIEEATLSGTTEKNSAFSGKTGNHTAHLQALLQEMQQLQRAYPGCEW